MKCLLGVPLIFSIGAFVLSVLSLLAGFQKGFLEDYSILTLNTTALGQDAIQAIANGSISSSSLEALGIGSDAASAIQNSLDGPVASGAAAQIGSNLASQLGIGEFYTFHAMDFCQGKFEPNPTTVGAARSVTFCSAPLDFAAYNLTGKLQQELSLGHYQLTLSQLGISKDTQDKLGYLTTVAKVLAVLFIGTAGATASSMFGTALGFVMMPERAPRRLSVLNFGAGLVAVVFTLASSLVVTFVPRGIAQELQSQLGDTSGLEVLTDMKLALLLWAACGMAVLTTLSWLCEVIVQCVRKRRYGRRSQMFSTLGK